jgi:DNA-binding transcriptional ArsR family regulator
MTLTHEPDTGWASSATGVRSTGLTSFGQQVVKRMNELGMSVDVSHCSDQTARDAVLASDPPTICSHSNAGAVCDSPRSCSDDLDAAVVPVRHPHLTFVAGRVIRPSSARDRSEFGASLQSSIKLNRSHRYLAERKPMSPLFGRASYPERMPPYDKFRALAHPLRVRILDVLTDEHLTAAEVSERVGTTKTNAAYHLRRLVHAGHVAVVETRTVVGGTANVYTRSGRLDALASDPQSVARYVDAVAASVRGRFAQRSLRRKATVIDAELWVAEDVWRQRRNELAALAQSVHDSGLAAGTPGTIRVSISLITFEMRSRDAHG